ncbi:hypothetical protein CkaCkLH20_00724 [Colletotrichum karsti]|uniref:Uncharacterized protein n=1 Tax=Colletotrichum karsti TaxID=1095194 RepID=A0A9P6LPV5_9PEZI|nr:uncharacterized protein CkaCkLH20_00724 [Colletotrichum karsti]KAF9881578.1 hypothetical protein CkaCkLH20_00724 [Colletotrichum karsti]
MSNSAVPTAMTNHAATIPPPSRPLQPLAAWEQHAHNASVRHPVFFTEKLRRPPLILSPGMGLSPVAHGYVYQDGRRADGSSAPKL